MVNLLYVGVVKHYQIKKFICGNYGYLDFLLDYLFYFIILLFYSFIVFICGRFMYNNIEIQIWNTNQQAIDGAKQKWTGYQAKQTNTEGNTVKNTWKREHEEWKMKTPNGHSSKTAVNWAAQTLLKTAPNTRRTPQRYKISRNSSQADTSWWQQSPKSKRWKMATSATIKNKRPAMGTRIKFENSRNTCGCPQIINPKFTTRLL